MSAFEYQSYNWLTHRLMWEKLSLLCRTNARGTLIDVGCGSGPYRRLVEPHVETYLGIDYPAGSGQPNASVYADAMRLPVRDASVDTVLCTEVIEHLPRPAECFAEFVRVLRPGGHLILTTPLFWHLHEEPRDYYRYTSHGLRYLMTANGLEPEAIIPITGFVATFTQASCYFLHFGIFGARFLRWLTTPLNWLAQRVAYAINKLDHTTGFTNVYVCAARKPSR
jgi:ubiquinone/menaquinone biosynthesis C-methylase UbiE